MFCSNSREIGSYLYTACDQRVFAIGEQKNTANSGSIRKQDTTHDIKKKKTRKGEENIIMYPLCISMYSYNMCVPHNNCQPSSPSYPPLPYPVL